MRWSLGRFCSAASLAPASVDKGKWLLQICAKRICDSAWAFTQPFCANLEAGPSAAPHRGKFSCSCASDPTNPSPASLERQTSFELEFNPVRATAMEATVRTFHAARLGIRCKDLLGSGWTCGHSWALGDFQDVSAWLTSLWACSSLQSPSFPSVSFCLRNLCEGCKGFAPFCTGVQKMFFVVASNVFLWQRQSTARGLLGRASQQWREVTCPLCSALVR